MAKFTKLGNVMMSKANKPYVRLGNPGDKYKPFNVTVTVTDLQGNVIATALNPIVNVKNPRENPNLKPGQAEKIPDFIKQELTLIEND